MSIEQLFAAAGSEEPVAFRAAFEEMMAPRILDKIQEIQKETAAEMFNDGTSEKVGEE